MDTTWIAVIVVGALTLTFTTGQNYNFQPCSPVNYLAAYPGNCNRFLACATYGYVPMDCPANLAFNEIKQVCDYNMFVPGCKAKQPTGCSSNPCMMGRCKETTLNPRGYVCECYPGFDGSSCFYDKDECNNSPCVRGKCINTIGSFKCDCTGTGYGGELCNWTTTPCISGEPCVYGTCRTSSSGNTCVCNTGYTGRRCETNMNPCLEYPCENNGRCSNPSTGKYTCDCSGTGFTGELCTVPDGENKCNSNPCLNNGRCKPLINSFQCDCSGTGYTGVLCNLPEGGRDCDSNPCLNNGRCTPGVNTYSCDCSGTGFTGLNCNVQDNCANDPCSFGQCINIDSSFRCECDPGYEGFFCEFPKDGPCSKKPCLNGVCVENSQSYSCDCTGTDFVGDLCQFRVGSDECLSKPCQNGGTCVDGENMYTCICPAGFTGSNCQQRTGGTQCVSNPCVRGQCVVGTSGNTCDCTGTGYAGPLCNSTVCPDSNNPCKNGGTCFMNGSGDYSCSCPPGLSGSNCERVIPPVECPSYPCPIDVPRHNYPDWNSPTCESYYSCTSGTLKLNFCPTGQKFDVVTMACQDQNQNNRFFCDIFQK